MRRIRAIAIAIGAILLLLVRAQIFLPGIAENRLRDQLAKKGDVIEVKVSAFPAIELLWRHADSVTIRMGAYHADPGQIGSQLGQAGNAGTIDASAAEVDSGLLTLHDATLHKRGDQLFGSARITEADLVKSFPILDSVQPIASGNGELVLRGTASLFGVSATVDAIVSTRNGAIVVAPDVPLGGLATVTVFSNPHIDVESVSAAAVAGGFTVFVRAKLT